MIKKSNGILILITASGLLLGAGCSSSRKMNPETNNPAPASGSVPSFDPGLTGLIRPGAQLHLVSDQFSFTEGPATDKKGNVYFTDQPNNRIWKWETDGTLSVFMENAGRSNGLFFDRKGNLLACADEKNELWSISPKGAVTVLLQNEPGQRLNGPNDLWERPEGGIFFTDPYYQRSYWERKKPDIKGEKVYYLPPGSKQPVVVEDSMRQPNGIIGSADGKLLYVADIGAGKTYRYNIGEDGSLGNRILFAPEGSDGMTLDAQGNLYLTGKGVTVYSRDGKRLGKIPVPGNWTGNVTFAGKKRDLLFITASKAVYTLPMQVRGAP